MRATHQTPHCSTLHNADGPTRHLISIRPSVAKCTLCFTGPEQWQTIRVFHFAEVIAHIPAIRCFGEEHRPRHLSFCSLCWPMLASTYRETKSLFLPLGNFNVFMAPRKPNLWENQNLNSRPNPTDVVDGISFPPLPSSWPNSLCVLT